MATKTKKTLKDKYKPNQFVVHPHHGAAKVIRKVNKNVEVFVEGEPKSKRIQYFEIEVLTDGLLVMVPVDSVDEVIRPVISKNAVSKKVFPIFKEKPDIIQCIALKPILYTSLISKLLIIDMS